MSWTSWLIFFLVLQVIHGLGTWKMYVAAGHKAWQAFVPVWNAVILMKIINRPWYWTILLFLPVVNLIMLPVTWVETIRAFGYNSSKDTVLVILTAGFYIYYINYTQALVHKKDRSLQPRTAAGEWTSSILFAVVAATIVHTYVMQPFIIPTSSLEKTLLTGDFLFVSKFHYGARLPMTPIAAPMVHDTIPVLGVKSYLARPQLPYLRLPGFTKIERNDIVVFNWPVDTIDQFPPKQRKYFYKPIDKKSNYVKRCVAVAGDTMSMKNGKVFINGAPLELPGSAKLQRSYELETDGHQFSSEEMIFTYDITDGYQQGQRRDNGKNVLIVKAATEEAIDKLKATGHILDVQVQDQDLGTPYRADLLDPNDSKSVFSVPFVFPYDGRYFNNNDDRAAFLIPEEGTTVQIDYKNISYFKRIIEVYEGSEMGIFNQISLLGNQVLLNGAPLTSYTFKQNYYWLMGDNRDNSLDSRFWGYVPKNHVVGKPVFVWMSYDTRKPFPSGFRFDRMFTTINTDSKPTSYLVYFLVVLIGYFVVRKILKNRKANQKKS